MAVKDESLEIQKQEVTEPISDNQEVSTVDNSMPTNDTYTLDNANQKINDMYDAMNKATTEQYEGQLEVAKQEAEQQRPTIEKEYNDNANDLAYQYNINRRNMAMTDRSNGLSTGTFYERQNALSQKYTSTYAQNQTAKADALAQVDVQLAKLESEYRNQISQAITKNDIARAQALYDEWNNGYTRDKAQADTLAQYGDFTGYQKLGYTDEQIQQMVDEYNRQKDIEDLSAKLQKAATLAASGDFSGYLEAGYSEQEVANMRNYWIYSNPMAAYILGMITLDQYNKIINGEYFEMDGAGTGTDLTGGGTGTGSGGTGTGGTGSGSSGSGSGGGSSSGGGSGSGGGSSSSGGGSGSGGSGGGDYSGGGNQTSGDTTTGGDTTTAEEKKEDISDNKIVGHENSGNVTGNVGETIGSSDLSIGDIMNIISGGNNQELIDGSNSGGDSGSGVGSSSGSSHQQISDRGSKSQEYLNQASSMTLDEIDSAIDEAVKNDDYSKAIAFIQEGLRRRGTPIAIPTDKIAEYNELVASLNPATEENTPNAIQAFFKRYRTFVESIGGVSVLGELSDFIKNISDKIKGNETTDSSEAHDNAIDQSIAEHNREEYEDLMSKIDGMSAIELEHMLDRIDRGITYVSKEYEDPLRRYIERKLEYRTGQEEIGTGIAKSQSQEDEDLGQQIRINEGKSELDKYTLNELTAYISDPTLINSDDPVDKALYEYAQKLAREALEEQQRLQDLLTADYNTAPSDYAGASVGQSESGKSGEQLLWELYSTRADNMSDTELSTIIHEIIINGGDRTALKVYESKLRERMSPENLASNSIAAQNARTLVETTGGALTDDKKAEVEKALGDAATNGVITWNRGNEISNQMNNGEISMEEAEQILTSLSTATNAQNSGMTLTEYYRQHPELLVTNQTQETTGRNANSSSQHDSNRKERNTVGTIGQIAQNQSDNREMGVTTTGNKTTNFGSVTSGRTTTTTTKPTSTQNTTYTGPVNTGGTSTNYRSNSASGSRMH